MVAGIGVASLMATACIGGGGDGASDALVQTMLDATPAQDYAGTGAVFTVVDLAAIAEQQDIAREGDPGSWAAPALSGKSVEDGGIGLQIRVPLAQNAALSHEAWSAETGLSLNDIDRAAELSVGRDTFVALVGPGGWNPDAPEIAEGVHTLGEGDDYSQNLEGRTVLRPLGMPLRIAELDGVLAMSRSTATIEAWHSGTAATLGDDPRFIAAATELDRAGAIAATIFATDFARPDGVVDAPFEVIGIGNSFGDGAAIETIVYVFADEGAAAASKDELQSAWASGSERDSPDVAYGDRQASLEVISSGRTVVVTVGVPVDQSASAVTYFYRLESVFAHR